MQGSTRILWITPQYLKDNTIINDNVEDNILQVNIRTAEDKYLHPLLGTQMTIKINKLISDSIISGSTIPTEYKTLIDDYIIPCLVEYSVYENVPFTYKFRNKGISKQTSPDSIPAELDELTYLRNNIRDTAQFYGERLVTYLRVGYTNNQMFPEYLQTQIGDIKPATGDYFNGIHVPKRNRNTTNWLGYGLGKNLDL